MVLVLNGVLQEECPLDTASLFMQHPVYRDTANQLLSIPTKAVSLITWRLSCKYFIFIYWTYDFSRIDRTRRPSLRLTARDGMRRSTWQECSHHRLWRCHHMHYCCCETFRWVVVNFIWSMASSDDLIRTHSFLRLRSDSISTSRWKWHRWSSHSDGKRLPAVGEMQFFILQLSYSSAATGFTCEWISFRISRGKNRASTHWRI